MTHQDTTPGMISPAIREFCRQIDPSREPLLVPVRPAGGAAFGNPFALVKDHASRHGGGVQYGWSLSEQPGWYLEAEFHGVWVAPTGELVDIVGRADGRTAVPFLPDSRRTYRGENLPNRFFALSTSPDVLAMVQDAEFHARLRAETETRARRERVRPGAVSRNEPCPCGSGLKSKTTPARAAAGSSPRSAAGGEPIRFRERPTNETRRAVTRRGMPPGPQDDVGEDETSRGPHRSPLGARRRGIMRRWNAADELV